jgi:ATP-dependent HslUV protease, peptidase subunit HslV
VALAAAAKALLDRDDLDAETVARKAMNIASEICVFTNKEFVVEVVDTTKGQVKD